MTKFPSHSMVIAAALAVAMFPPRSQGQDPSGPPASRPPGASVAVTPGPGYRAGPFARAVLGSGWRDLWVTPVVTPVFDLGTFGGGMRIDKQGGNFQSVTLHMTEETGWREYRFRSVDKFPMRNLPPTLKGTTVGAYLQDQVSTLFPAAPLVVAPFLRAIDALHVDASLYVMRDDPRLGSYRETFAGILGTVELKGSEAPDDKPGFAGSSKIKDTDGFFEDFWASRAHRIDEREFLAVRMIDFLINDPDRTTDNFDWARFGEQDNYSWRPIARDRDRAFTDANGLLNRFVVRKFYPKAIEFGAKYSLKGLTDASHQFDRRLLQRLTSEDFAQVALRVQRAVSDDVIEQAIAALPREWREQTGVAQRLRTTLIARRARLPEFAMAFYRDLAGETDIMLTDDAERVDVVRLADGRVMVTVPAGTETAQIAETRNADGSVTRTMNGSLDSGNGERRPFFRRTFTPSETNEIRVYLGKGNDSAMVRGAPSDAIMVRVIGGKDDDVLTDSAGGGATFLYDEDGKNTFVTNRSTRVSTRPWTPPKLESGFKLGQAWRPDWGGSAGWSPAVTYTEGAGVIVGAGPRFKSYGFRRLPHHWEAGANLLVGTGNGRLAVTADADYRAENSPLAFTLAMRASQLDAVRFYGYGNDTPDVGRDLSLVEQNIVAVEPSLVWYLGWRSREGLGNPMREGVDSAPPPGRRPMVGRLLAGPLLYWTDPQPLAGSPLAAGSVLGANSFSTAGFRVGVELDATDRDPIPTRGWNLRANLAGYPVGVDLAGMDLTESLGTATATAAAYVPLFDNGPNLALRAGGSLASGSFPVQYAPAIGGSTTLRGYRWQRYAGDRAVNASTELRVPAGTVNFLVRSQLGVFALADVGRVWFDGRSDGGWHTGLGGGFWLSTFGKTVSFTYARGEEQRLYLKSGLAF